MAVVRIRFGWNGERKGEGTIHNRTPNSEFVFLLSLLLSLTASPFSSIQSFVSPTSFVFHDQKHCNRCRIICHLIVPPAVFLRRQSSRLGNLPTTERSNKQLASGLAIHHHRISWKTPYSSRLDYRFVNMSLVQLPGPGAYISSKRFVLARRAEIHPNYGSITASSILSGTSINLDRRGH